MSKGQPADSIVIAM